MAYPLFGLGSTVRNPPPAITTPLGHRHGMFPQVFRYDFSSGAEWGGPENDNSHIGVVRTIRRCQSRGRILFQQFLDVDGCTFGLRRDPLLLKS